MEYSTEGLLELVDFDKYRVYKKEEQHLKLQNEIAEVTPIPVSEPNIKITEKELVPLDKIVEVFNTVFGNIEGIEPSILEAQAKYIGKNLLDNDIVRDALLNNDESTQIQVIHENNKKEILKATLKSQDLQKFYLQHTNKQNELDNAILMYLQEQVNPAYNESLLIEKIVESMLEDFKIVCTKYQTNIEEITSTLFQILNAEAFSAIDGVKKLRNTLNLCYRTQGRDEDYQDWVFALINKFEAFMKKYISYAKEWKLLK